jgi:hypothetical protein
MSSYALGRSPALWPEPLAFRPARFAPDAEAALHRFQFVPFGAGARMCLGASFAQMSVSLMVATLLQKFAFEPVRWELPSPALTRRGGACRPKRVRARKGRAARCCWRCAPCLRARRAARPRPRRLCLRNCTALACPFPHPHPFWTVRPPFFHAPPPARPYSQLIPVGYDITMNFAPTNGLHMRVSARAPAAPAAAGPGAAAAR